MNNIAGAPAVAPTAGPRKTLGRRQAEPAPDARPSKTLGRKRPEAAPGEQLPPGGAAWPSGVPTRAQVADRLARHLSGSESASALAAFAREGWMRLDAGAEVPLSERPLLEEVLRRLMFLDRKAGAMDAQDLVELLARLQ